jgi:predicted CXXCH cytochrome family protein
MTARRSRSAWPLLLALLLLAGQGCLSPQERYRVLNYFFDGVPPPEGIAAPGTAATAEPSPPSRKIVRAPPAQELTVHEPECDECHNRSGGNVLRVAKRRLCWECHDRDDFFESTVHGPVAAGECTACHSPHRTPRPNLLRHPPKALCGQCHDRSTFARLEEHQAEAGQDCVGCHNPHTSERAYMLREDVS